jgi:hypothetical protein
MTARSTTHGGPSIQSTLHDPMRDWTNDDLLLNDSERDYFAQRHPSLARIFDWPELRRVFEDYEKPARRARERSRRYGVFAVVLGFAGLALTALTPLLAKLLSLSLLFPNDPDSAERLIGFLAAVLIVAGSVEGFRQALTGLAKREWLINRYRTERIRQFHFQLIVNNPGKAAAALGDDAALESWRTLRNGKLADFLHDTGQTLDIVFDRLEDDHAEEDVWADRAWSDPPSEPLETPGLVGLLEGMEKVRIGVQERYTELKLKPGPYSPQTRAEWLHGASDAFTAAILLVTVAIGAVYMYGEAGPRLWLLSLVGLAGTLTAAVVALRVLNEGLQLRSETERYRWYLASVRSIRRRFEKVGSEDRIRLLRELERLAYQEMRRFLITFKEARFIM